MMCHLWKNEDKQCSQEGRHYAKPLRIVQLCYIVNKSTDFICFSSFFFFLQFLLPYHRIQDFYTHKSGLVATYLITDVKLFVQIFRLRFLTFRFLFGEKKHLPPFTICEPHVLICISLSALPPLGAQSFAVSRDRKSTEAKRSHQQAGAFS